MINIYIIYLCKRNGLNMEAYEPDDEICINLNDERELDASAGINRRNHIADTIFYINTISYIIYVHQYTCWTVQWRYLSISYHSQT